MTDIILSVENNEAVVSSRQIAEDFGKRHNDVMEAIRSILATENSVTKFFTNQRLNTEVKLFRCI